MKSRETTVRLKRFEADEKARKVAGMEQMIRDFEMMVGDLDRQIQAEEDRTGVRDPMHFAYSTFAKSAANRRTNLRQSIDNLRLQLDAAVKERDEVLADLSRNDEPEPRDLMRSRRRGDVKMELRTSSATR
jgi:flagellar FliJ protein